MSDLIVAIPLLVEWTLVVTIATPFALVNNRWVYAHPSGGLFLWFASFGSAVLALAVALALGLGSIFETYGQLQTASNAGEVWLGLGTSFAPWILLALGGITLALVVQKLEPESQPRQSFSTLDGLQTKTNETYRGIPLVALDLQAPLVFSLGNSTGSHGSLIAVSRGAFDSLSGEQLESVLEHEYFHLRARHPLAQRVVKVLSLLTAPVLTTKLFARETALLTELAADRAAANSCGNAPTLAALEKLIGDRGDRESRIRIAVRKAAR